MVKEFSSFSNCGNYYVNCGSDGKLKIWETNTGTLKQEYTPNLHLTSPYTCLTWMSSSNSYVNQNKRRKSDGNCPLVAIGTQAGSVVLYSVTEGCTIGNLNDGHKASVQCMAWQQNAGLFTCSQDKFAHWDIKQKTIKSKWKNGETCTAMAVSDDGDILLTASQNIKWWNVEEKRVVRTFTGHATSIIKLVFLGVPSGDNYVVSAAQNDRLLNIWCLSQNSESQAVASLVMSDLVQSLSVNVSKDLVTNIAAVTQSGAMHLYSQQLNGKRKKPLKPTLTVMIASDTGQNKAKATPLNIVTSYLHSNLRALIVYGQPPFLAFENIKLVHSSEELCLVRKDPKICLTAHQELVSKVRAPEVNKDVQYMSGAVMNGSLPLKRGRGKESDVPMEERLENLALNQPLSSSQPTGEGMAHLLLQALQSKDKNLLRSVLFKRDETVIAQTVQRLPVQVITPLVKELTVLLQGSTFTSQMAAEWLKAVLAAHAGQLLSDPSVTAAFHPLLAQVEARLGFLTPLSRLRGRLDLLLLQLTGPVDRQIDSTPLLVHIDQDSEEGSDILGSDVEGDESEDRWDELTDDEVQLIESDDIELSS